MRRTRVFVWTLLGCAMTTFGCSSSSNEAASTSERVGTQRQRLVGAQKVCQLIGNHDYQSGNPTKSLTQQWGVFGTDLGYPVHDTTRNRIWFLFGDMFPHIPPGGSDNGSPDAMGFTTDVSLPADECPTLGFVGTTEPPSFNRITLDGAGLLGFEVPTGATYDPEYFDEQSQTYGRIIAGVMKRGASEGTLAESASGGSAPQAFKAIVDAYGFRVLADSARFMIMAPVITEARKVKNADLLPGSSDRVLLVFGTGEPMRQSAVYVAAVKIDKLHEIDKWGFFDGTATTWSLGSSSAAVPLFRERPPPNPLANATGCAGEISVSFNSVFRKWMLMYTCGNHAAAAYFGGRGPTDNVVLLRMSETDDPLSRWSAAIPLLVPKKDGAPADADPAFGTFVHRGNLRMKRAGLFNDLQLLPDEAAIGNPSPLPTSCVPSGGFPSYCPPPQDHDPTGVGECCTQADRCCDSMFDKIDLTDPVTHIAGGMSSNVDGDVYAAYAVQPWAAALNGTASQPPTKQKLYYVVSTWNPYTVVLMSNELLLEDVDNDGVDDREDNCPTAFNPKQENCNLAAELAWNERHPTEQVAKLGDACDPVPCPHVDQKLTSTSWVTGPCGTSPWTPSVCSGRQVRDYLDLAPVGSSPLTERMRAAAASLPTNINVPAVPTWVRYCQNNPPDFECGAPAKMGDDQVFAFPTLSDETIDRSRIWHRVLMHRVCAPNEIGCINGAMVEREDSITIDYGTGRARYAWEYANDYAFWTTPGARKIPDNPSTACTNTGLYGQGTCLAGRLWTHGDTVKGSDVYNEHDFVFDTPSQTYVQVGAHGHELANHFFDAIPDRPFLFGHGGMQARPLFFIRFTLPDPAPVWKFASGQVLPIINEDGQWSAVFDDGHREPIDGVFTAGARYALAETTFTWASAVEASPYAGNGMRPRGVAVQRDGATIVLRETLVDSGSASIDTGGSPELMSGPDGSPAARTNFVATYSRARGRVFLAGGQDATTGAPLSDVWMFELDRGYWKKVPRVDGELVEVLAATYSYRDGTLWLVDRDARDPSRVMMRLLRVDPATGSWEVVYAADPQTTAEYGTKALGVDADGSILLTVSNDMPQRHRIARITPMVGGRYEVAATDCRKRALVTGTSALADASGFALFFKQDAELDVDCTEGAQPPLGVPGERLAELPLVSATLSDLERLLR